MRSWLAPVALAFALVQGGVVVGPSPAFAGPDLWTDVVAPYIHFPTAIPPALGPFSTVFMIRSPKGAPVVVNAQCFNNLGQSVGPSGGQLAAFQTFMMTPDSPFPIFDLPSHPNFTGIGWCYFSSADKFSVDVVWGDYGGPPGTIAFNGLPDFTQMRMFSSNSSVGVAIAVAQATVAAGSVAAVAVPGIGNVPIYTGGNWIDFLVLVNPTASSGQATVSVFNCAGCSPASTPTPVAVPLPSRGMGLVVLSNSASPFPNGNATISGTCCFVGWNWAFNVVTRQAVFREVAIDRDTSRFLTAADRP